MFGTIGAASSVRRVDLASVDTTALVVQLDQQANEPRRRPFRVSVFQLAANMGTSVEMIESFYGKKRMRDPKMATEVTKFTGR